MAGGFERSIGVIKPFLTDEQWEQIAPLLPQTRSRGRPFADNRQVLEGILWVLRSGARWRDLPHNTPVPRPAGGVCVTGKSKGCGWICGGPS